MSASNEKLLERINVLKNLIEDIEERGEDPHPARIQLEKLVQKFNLNNKMLNEGKTILKS